MAGRSAGIVKTDLAIGTRGSLTMFDALDRPGKAFAAGTYAGAGSFGGDSDDEGPGGVEAKSELLGLKTTGRSDEIVKTDLEIGTGGSLTMFDALDRPGKAFAAGAYAGAGSFGGDFGDEGGVYAGAGMGHARAEWRCFDAQAKGPNIGAGAELSTAAGARAFAKAELASASASAGPVKATIGLSADTGVGIGPGGVEAKVLGTGFTIGRKIGFSVLGSGFEFKLW